MSYNPDEQEELDALPQPTLELPTLDAIEPIEIITEEVSVEDPFIEEEVPVEEPEVDPEAEKKRMEYMNQLGWWGKDEEEREELFDQIVNQVTPEAMDDFMRDYGDAMKDEMQPKGSNLWDRYRDSLNESVGWDKMRPHDRRDVFEGVLGQVAPEARDQFMSEYGNRMFMESTDESFPREVASNLQKELGEANLLNQVTAMISADPENALLSQDSSGNLRAAYAVSGETNKIRTWLSRLGFTGEYSPFDNKTSDAEVDVKVFHEENEKGKVASYVPTKTFTGFLNDFAEEYGLSQEELQNAINDMTKANSQFRDDEGPSRILSSGDVLPDFQDDVWLDVDKGEVLLREAAQNGANEYYGTHARQFAEGFAKDIMERRLQSAHDNHMLLPNRSSFIEYQELSGGRGQLVDTASAIDEVTSSAHGFLSPDDWLAENYEDNLGMTPERLLEFEEANKASGLGAAERWITMTFIRASIKGGNFLRGLPAMANNILGGVETEVEREARVTDGGKLGWFEDFAKGRAESSAYVQRIVDSGRLTYDHKGALGLTSKVLEEIPSLGVQIITTRGMGGLARGIVTPMTSAATASKVGFYTAYASSSTILAGGQSYSMELATQLADGASWEEANDKAAKAAVSTAMIVSVFSAVGLGGFERLAAGRGVSGLTMRDMMKKRAASGMSWKLFREGMRNFAVPFMRSVLGEAFEEGIDEWNQAWVTADPEDSLSDIWSNFWEGFIVGGAVGGAAHLALSSGQGQGLEGYMEQMSKVREQVEGSMLKFKEAARKEYEEKFGHHSAETHFNPEPGTEPNPDNFLNHQALMDEGGSYAYHVNAMAEFEAARENIATKEDLVNKWYEAKGALDNTIWKESKEAAQAGIDTYAEVAKAHDQFWATTMDSLRRNDMPAIAKALETTRAVGQNTPLPAELVKIEAELASETLEGLIGEEAVAAAKAEGKAISPNARVVFQDNPDGTQRLFYVGSRALYRTNFSYDPETKSWKSDDKGTPVADLFVKTTTFDLTGEAGDVSTPGTEQSPAAENTGSPTAEPSGVDVPTKTASKAKPAGESKADPFGPEDAPAGGVAPVSVTKSAPPAAAGVAAETKGIADSDRKGESDVEMNERIVFYPESGGRPYYLHDQSKIPEEANNLDGATVAIEGYESANAAGGFTLTKLEGKERSEAVEEHNANAKVKYGPSDVIYRAYDNSTGRDGNYSAGELTFEAPITSILRPPTTPTPAAPALTPEHQLNLAEVNATAESPAIDTPELENASGRLLDNARLQEINEQLAITEALPGGLKAQAKASQAHKDMLTEKATLEGQLPTTETPPDLYAPMGTPEGVVVPDAKPIAAGTTIAPTMLQEDIGKDVVTGDVITAPDGSVGVVMSISPEGVANIQPYAEGMDNTILPEEAGMIEAMLTSITKTLLGRNKISVAEVQSLIESIANRLYAGSAEIKFSSKFKGRIYVSFKSGTPTIEVNPEMMAQQIADLMAQHQGAMEHSKTDILNDIGAIIYAEVFHENTHIPVANSIPRQMVNGKIETVKEASARIMNDVLKYSTDEKAVVLRELLYNQLVARSHNTGLDVSKVTPDTVADFLNKNENEKVAILHELIVNDVTQLLKQDTPLQARQNLATFSQAVTAMKEAGMPMTKVERMKEVLRRAFEAVRNFFKAASRAGLMPESYKEVVSDVMRNLADSGNLEAKQFSEPGTYVDPLLTDIDYVKIFADRLQRAPKLVDKETEFEMIQSMKDTIEALRFASPDFENESFIELTENGYAFTENVKPFFKSIHTSPGMKLLLDKLDGYVKRMNEDGRMEVGRRGQEAAQALFGILSYLNKGMNITSRADGATRSFTAKEIRQSRNAEILAPYMDDAVIFRFDAVMGRAETLLDKAKELNAIDAETTTAGERAEIAFIEKQNESRVKAGKDPIPLGDGINKVNRIKRSILNTPSLRDVEILDSTEEVETKHMDGKMYKHPKKTWVSLGQAIHALTPVSQGEIESNAPNARKAIRVLQALDLLSMGRIENHDLVRPPKGQTSISRVAIGEAGQVIAENMEAVEPMETGNFFQMLDSLSLSQMRRLAEAVATDPKNQNEIIVEMEKAQARRNTVATVLEFEGDFKWLMGLGPKPSVHRRGKYNREWKPDDALPKSRKARNSTFTMDTGAFSQLIGLSNAKPESKRNDIDPAYKMIEVGGYTFNAYRKTEGEKVDAAEVLENGIRTAYKLLGSDGPSSWGSSLYGIQKRDAAALGELLADGVGDAWLMGDPALQSKTRQTLGWPIEVTRDEEGRENEWWKPKMITYPTTADLRRAGKYEHVTTGDKESGKSAREINFARILETQAPIVLEEIARFMNSMVDEHTRDGLLTHTVANYSGGATPAGAGFALIAPLMTRLIRNMINAQKARDTSYDGILGTEENLFPEGMIDFPQLAKRIEMSLPDLGSRSSDILGTTDMAKGEKRTIYAQYQELLAMADMVNTVYSTSLQRAAETNSENSRNRDDNPSSADHVSPLDDITQNKIGFRVNHMREARAPGSTETGQRFARPSELHYRITQLLKDSNRLVAKTSSVTQKKANDFAENPSFTDPAFLVGQGVMEIVDPDTDHQAYKVVNEQAYDDLAAFEERVNDLAKKLDTSPSALFSAFNLADVASQYGALARLFDGGFRTRDTNALHDLLSDYGDIVQEHKLKLIESYQVVAYGGLKEDTGHEDRSDSDAGDVSDQMSGTQTDFIRSEQEKVEVKTRQSLARVLTVAMDAIYAGEQTAIQRVVADFMRVDAAGEATWDTERLAPYILEKLEFLMQDEQGMILVGDNVNYPDANKSGKDANAALDRISGDETHDIDAPFMQGSLFLQNTAFKLGSSEVDASVGLDAQPEQSSRKNSEALLREEKKVLEMVKRKGGMFAQAEHGHSLGMAEDSIGALVEMIEGLGVGVIYGGLPVILAQETDLPTVVYRTDPQNGAPIIVFPFGANPNTKNTPIYANRALSMVLNNLQSKHDLGLVEIMDAVRGATIHATFKNGPLTQKSLAQSYYAANIEEFIQRKIEQAAAKGESVTTKQIADAKTRMRNIAERNAEIAMEKIDRDSSQSSVTMLYEQMTPSKVGVLDLFNPGSELLVASVSARVADLISSPSSRLALSLLLNRTAVHSSPDFELTAGEQEAVASYLESQTPTQEDVANLPWWDLDTTNITTPGERAQAEDGVVETDDLPMGKTNRDAAQITADDRAFLDLQERAAATVITAIINRIKKASPEYVALSDTTPQRTALYQLLQYAAVQEAPAPMVIDSRGNPLDPVKPKSLSDTLHEKYFSKAAQKKGSLNIDSLVNEIHSYVLQHYDAVPKMNKAYARQYGTFSFEDTINQGGMRNGWTALRRRKGAIALAQALGYTRDDDTGRGTTFSIQRDLDDFRRRMADAGLNTYFPFVENKTVTKDKDGKETTHITYARVNSRDVEALRKDGQEVIWRDIIDDIAERAEEDAKALDKALDDAVGDTMLESSVRQKLFDMQSEFDEMLNSEEVSYTKARQKILGNFKGKAAEHLASLLPSYGEVTDLITGAILRSVTDGITSMDGVRDALQDGAAVEAARRADKAYTNSRLGKEVMAMRAVVASDQAVGTVRYNSVIKSYNEAMDRFFSEFMAKNSWYMQNVKSRPASFMLLPNENTEDSIKKVDNFLKFLSRARSKSNMLGKIKRSDAKDIAASANNKIGGLDGNFFRDIENFITENREAILENMQEHNDEGGNTVSYRFNEYSKEGAEIRKQLEQMIMERVQHDPETQSQEIRDILKGAISKVKAYVDRKFEPKFEEDGDVSEDSGEAIGSGMFDTRIAITRLLDQVKEMKQQTKDGNKGELSEAHPSDKLKALRDGLKIITANRLMASDDIINAFKGVVRNAAEAKKWGATKNGVYYNVEFDGNAKTIGDVTTERTIATVMDMWGDAWSDYYMNRAASGDFSPGYSKAAQKSDAADKALREGMFRPGQTAKNRTPLVDLIFPHGIVQTVKGHSVTSRGRAKAARKSAGQLVRTVAHNMGGVAAGPAAAVATDAAFRTADRMLQWKRESLENRIEEKTKKLNEKYDELQVAVTKLKFDEAAAREALDTVAAYEPTTEGKAREALRLLDSTRGSKDPEITETRKQRETQDAERMKAMMEIISIEEQIQIIEDQIDEATGQLGPELGMVIKEMNKVRTQAVENMQILTDKGTVEILNSQLETQNLLLSTDSLFQNAISVLVPVEHVEYFGLRNGAAVAAYQNAEFTLDPTPANSLDAFFYGDGKPQRVAPQMMKFLYSIDALRMALNKHPAKSAPVRNAIKNLNKAIPKFTPRGFRQAVKSFNEEIESERSRPQAEVNIEAVVEDAFSDMPSLHAPTDIPLVTSRPEPRMAALKLGPSSYNGQRAAEIDKEMARPLHTVNEKGLPVRSGEFMSTSGALTIVNDRNKMISAAEVLIKTKAIEPSDMMQTVEGGRISILDELTKMVSAIHPTEGDYPNDPDYLGRFNTAYVHAITNVLARETHLDLIDFSSGREVDHWMMAPFIKGQGFMFKHLASTKTKGLNDFGTKRGQDALTRIFAIYKQGSDFSGGETGGAAWVDNIVTYYNNESDKIGLHTERKLPKMQGEMIAKIRSLHQTYGEDSKGFIEMLGKIFDANRTGHARLQGYGKTASPVEGRKSILKRVIDVPMSLLAGWFGSKAHMANPGMVIEDILNVVEKHANQAEQELNDTANEGQGVQVITRMIRAVEAEFGEKATGWAKVVTAIHIEAAEMYAEKMASVGMSPSMLNYQPLVPMQWSSLLERDYQTEKAEDRTISGMRKLEDAAWLKAGKRRVPEEGEPGILVLDGGSAMISMVKDMARRAFSHTGVQVMENLVGVHTPTDSGKYKLSEGKTGHLHILAEGMSKRDQIKTANAAANIYAIVFAEVDKLSRRYSDESRTAWFLDRIAETGTSMLLFSLTNPIMQMVIPTVAAKGVMLGLRRMAGFDSNPDHTIRKAISGYFGNVARVAQVSATSIDRALQAAELHGRMLKVNYVAALVRSASLKIAHSKGGRWAGLALERMASDMKAQKDFIDQYSHITATRMSGPMVAFDTGLSLESEPISPREPLHRKVKLKAKQKAKTVVVGASVGARIGTGFTITESERSAVYANFFGSLVKQLAIKRIQEGAGAAQLPVELLSEDAQQKWAQGKLEFKHLNSKVLQAIRNEILTNAPEKIGLTPEMFAQAQGEYEIVFMSGQRHELGEVFQPDTGLVSKFWKAPIRFLSNHTVQTAFLAYVGAKNTAKLVWRRFNLDSEFAKSSKDYEEAAARIKQDIAYNARPMLTGPAQNGLFTAARYMYLTNGISYLMAALMGWDNEERKTWEMKYFYLLEYGKDLREQRGPVGFLVSLFIRGTRTPMGIRAWSGEFDEDTYAGDVSTFKHNMLMDTVAHWTPGVAPFLQLSPARGVAQLASEHHAKQVEGARFRGFDDPGMILGSNDQTFYDMTQAQKNLYYTTRFFRNQLADYSPHARAVNNLFLSPMIDMANAPDDMPFAEILSRGAASGALRLVPLPREVIGPAVREASPADPDIWDRAVTSDKAPSGGRASLSTF